MITLNNLGNCLITGSTGFVGRRLAELLAKSGNNLSVISRRVSGKYPGVSCNFIEDEIPRDIFSDIDTVFHLAGLAHDTKGRYQKSLYEKVNVDTTRKLAKISQEKNVKRFIFLSSVKASEIISTNPRTTGSYGLTKRKAELELKKISLESEMKIGILRSCLVYGPNMKGNLLAMLQAVNSGWFPRITKSDNKKSLIHVDDLAKALVFLANNHRAHRNTIYSGYIHFFE
jgi:nucleoside-diphosphate-sugar epimerase